MTTGGGGNKTTFKDPSTHTYSDIDPDHRGQPSPYCSRANFNMFNSTQAVSYPASRSSLIPRKLGTEMLTMWAAIVAISVLTCSCAPFLRHERSYDYYYSDYQSFDCSGHEYLGRVNGDMTCLHCINCPYGTRMSERCGFGLGNANITCLPCDDGRFSDSDSPGTYERHMCSPCRNCTELGREERSSCMSHADSVCSTECWDGWYDSEADRVDLERPSQCYPKKGPTSNNTGYGSSPESLPSPRNNTGYVSSSPTSLPWWAVVIIVLSFIVVVIIVIAIVAVVLWCKNRGEPKIGEEYRPVAVEEDPAGQPAAGEAGPAGLPGQPAAGEAGLAGPPGQPAAGEAGPPGQPAAGDAGPPGQPAAGDAGPAVPPHQPAAENPDPAGPPEQPAGPHEEPPNAANGLIMQEVGGHNLGAVFNPIQPMPSTSMVMENTVH